MAFLKRKRKFILKLLIIFFTAFSVYYFSQFEQAKAEDFNISNAQLPNLPLTNPIESINIADEFLYNISGIASYYAHRFHRRLTANGERFNMYDFTAAHKKLPFGTILRVTNLKNDQKILVRINDRGPYIGKRILDLSMGSAKAIGGLGLPRVKIEGFLHDENKIPKEADEEYYFGYSLDKDLVCIPESNLDKVDSTDNFTKAVRLYQEIIQRDTESDYYLFITAEKRFRKQRKKHGNIYIIAQIQESIKIDKDEIIMAQK